jgi:hypothetical protein
MTSRANRALWKGLLVDGVRMLGTWLVFTARGW